MEGVLQLYEPSETRSSRAGFQNSLGYVWNEYYFSLKDDLLLITDTFDKSLVRGVLHLKISRVINEPEEERILNRSHDFA